MTKEQRTQKKVKVFYDGKFRNVKNMAGHKNGQLKVISFSHIEKNLAYWNCECDCGNKVTKPVTFLTYRNIKQCGKHLEFGKPRSKVPEYGIWLGIKARCHRKSEPGYKYYGARGIKMCKRWKNSFSNFYADMGPRSNNSMSIDRINVNGDYCPENCRWASTKEQSINKRNTRRINYKGQMLTLKEFSEITGLNINTVKWKYSYNKKLLENYE